MKIVIRLDESDITAMIRQYVATKGCEYVDHTYLGLEPGAGTIEVEALFKETPAAPHPSPAAILSAALRTPPPAVTLSMEELLAPPRSGDDTGTGTGGTEPEVDEELVRILQESARLAEGKAG